jgi:hypothetical protein
MANKHFPPSPILQTDKATAIFEIQSTGKLRVTCNGWTDAQIFKPGMEDRRPVA